MGIEQRSGPDADRDKYDIARLLEYSGPSFQQEEPIADGLSMFDYRNTDENERNISTLLSSQGIPFNLERPKYGWTGTQIRLILTVPRDQQRQVETILGAAVKESVVDKVEGNEGLRSR